MTYSSIFNPALATSQSRNPRNNWLSALSLKNSAKTVPMDQVQLSRVSLRDRGGDLAKPWYIEFYTTYQDLETRHRVKANINRLKTAKERYSHADVIIKNLNIAHAMSMVDPIYNQVEYKSENKSYSSIQEVLETALDRLKPSLRSRSYTTYKSSIKLFNYFVGDKKLFELNERIVEDYILDMKANKKADRTIYGRIAVLNTFVSKIREIKDNPFRMIKTSKRTTGNTSIPWTSSEIKLLREYTSDKPHLSIYWGLIYYTAIRPNEIAYLQKKDIDIASKSIIIPIASSKVKKTLPVGIPKQFIHQLANYITGIPDHFFIVSKNLLPSQESSVGNRLSEAWKHQVKDKTSLKKNAYQLKHTAAIRMYKSGIGVNKIQNHFRHASTKQTEEYLKGLEPFIFTDMSEEFPDID